MPTEHLSTLESFTETSLPTLDVVALGALERFIKESPPSLPQQFGDRLLVLGSGNALITGRIIFADAAADFYDESHYKTALKANPSYTDVVIISASGSKHATEMAASAAEQGITTWLFTNTQDSPAAANLPPENVFVFPKNREPYTYNTSTYLGMILGKTQESPSAIHEMITNEIEPLIPGDLHKYDAFFFIVPPELDVVKKMLQTKFDELFGPKVSVRVFTTEQAKHAKTVIPSETELFVSFGEANDTFGLPDNRLNLPLPTNAGPAALMAIGYYFIGHIQKQHPPYFMDRIQEYMEETSAAFGQELSVVVE